MGELDWSQSSVGRFSQSGVNNSDFFLSLSSTLDFGLCNDHSSGIIAHLALKGPVGTTQISASIPGLKLTRALATA